MLKRIGLILICLGITAADSESLLIPISMIIVGGIIEIVTGGYEDEKRKSKR